MGIKVGLHASSENSCQTRTLIHTQPLASSKKLLSVGAAVVRSQKSSVYFLSKKVTRKES